MSGTVRELKDPSRPAVSDPASPKDAEIRYPGFGTMFEVHETRRLQTLVVRSGERFEFVPVESIDWIETANNYTCLHCSSTEYLYGESLAALEQRLDPGKFLCVHRRYMVNVTCIAAVHAIAGSIFELELRGGVRIKSGRQYSERIRKLLKAGS